MKNPIQNFLNLWKKAQEKKDPVADAIYLATVDTEGKPYVRTVLLKKLSGDRIGFVSRLGGRKNNHLSHQNDLEFCVNWSTLGLQVRLRCTTAPLNREDRDHLWSLRPRDAQIVYHMGLNQSSEIPSYDWLVNQFESLKEKWRDLKDIVLSKEYIGYELHPYAIEFLSHNITRLNRRDLYEKQGKTWIHKTLAP